MVKEGAADEKRRWANVRPRRNAMGEAVGALRPGLGNRKTIGQAAVIMAFLRPSKMGRVISACHFCSEYCSVDYMHFPASLV
jgi:hypothetical protein